ncbi:hypothetical protein [Thiobacillus denitrificans]|uniref:hypothetical protein n=1 Tax=Thiobacillus denitrificans TaxID=36861 RepID=UPI0012F7F98D|nr:hypothetical protein [Thiobacillus denitrificans]
MNSATAKKKTPPTSSTSNKPGKVTKLVVRVPRVAKPKSSQSGIPRPRTFQPTLLPRERKSEAPPLMRMLYRKMHEEGMEPQGLAAQLGISYAYLRSLLNENRSSDGPKGLDKNVIRRAADFLEMPVATAYVLAGILEPEDFFYKPTLAESVEAAYQDMVNNGLWAGFAPSEANWKRLPRHVKLSIAVLYEQVASKSFLQTAVAPLGYIETDESAEH